MSHITDHIWYPYTQMADQATAAARFVVTQGEGVFVHTRDGRKLLDGYSQMWCNPLGHAHPRINAALSAQAAKIAHSSLFSASNETSIELAAMVVSLCQEEFGVGEGCPQHVFFTDNGSTAVEVGLKMALQYHRNRGDKERTKLLCFSDAYHGDTAATMTLGGVELFRQAYQPITFEVLRASYPMQANSFDTPDPAERAAFDEACLELRQVFEGQGETIAGVVIEPAIQGAGGMRPCYPGFLKLLRELCDEYGTLLIADEVMTGFGRTGATFACAAEGVTPDIFAIGKAL
ncbi:MAG: aminotransferase class III-fold pyridoxal phosphate-dependent enzyme, partial [Planctomycetes bacterium]|nr:aminotransferase class III-fold pyridoxal phosphate-dependent enzyme [Planctomycetota bacterium]